MNEKHHKKSKPSSEIKAEHPENKLGGDERPKEPAVAEKKEPDPLAKIQSELEEKTREAAENYDKWLRSVAEPDNFRKRSQKEKADSLKFGNESLLRALLPVLDTLERAVEHGSKSGEKSPLLEGVEITLNQFLNVLERFGVRRISAVGEEFDPEKHEAVLQKESDQEPNRVLTELEKGYFYHDRLLRPAKVIVSKPMSSEE